MAKKAKNGRKGKQQTSEAPKQKSAGTGLERVMNYLSKRIPSGIDQSKNLKKT